jgi:hypothetical protein
VQNAAQHQKRSGSARAASSGPAALHSPRQAIFFLFSLQRVRVKSPFAVFLVAVRLKPPAQPTPAPLLYYATHPAVAPYCLLKKLSTESPPAVLLLLLAAAAAAGGGVRRAGTAAAALLALPGLPSRLAHGT